MNNFIRKYSSYIYISIVYLLILLQYPASLAIGPLILHKDIAGGIEPGYLLIWGLVRILLVIPLLFALLSKSDVDGEDLYLSLGKYKQVIKITFWGTFIFTIVGTILYPWFINTTKLSPILFLEYLPIFLLYAVSNAFVEETFFRGISLRYFNYKNSFWFANLIQSFFFALIHVINPMSANPWPFIVLTFFLGLFWGYLTKKTKSLIPAISLHVIADIFVAISLF